MQLNRFTDYALRVLIYLAHKGDELATIHEIALEYALSEGHLMKVVHHLGKRGYIVTLRGKGGGMRLARAPQEINVGAVVRDTEETLSIVECLKDHYEGDCKLFGACKLMGVLHEANRLFLNHLDQFTLADLLQSHTPQGLGGYQPITLRP
ncbi:MAG: Rrf2 family transcriptional regulator [Paludibacterium sp.]|uniref:RrF2 family transcriptional regulator n=1 Tax=Paludibacterium sp. TaxID=1917523 RepID=UPI0025E2DAC5|nr:Rrf2 family transcriptional regulator [Paludibacterium sp.]MBV8049379.1 Rrf2 family transcriptional regulator [Paludibacterium sp.]MBV8647545.1 Rrf2 family transcriptional regulator [Paludibacterium sp.]